MKVGAFTRPGDFEAATLTVSISDDRENWKEIGQGVNFRSFPVRIVTARLWAACQVKAEARYVRIKVALAEGAKRLMLSEVALLAAADGRADQRRE